MQKPISITAIASISALGTKPKTIWEQYLQDEHALRNKTFDSFEAFVGEIPEEYQSEIEQLRQSNDKYASLDDTVLYAIYVSRKALAQANWGKDSDFGINIGSSRGATQLFEEYHEYFLKEKKAKTLSSPTTTLGNISSWVAQDLQSQGPEISHSITCSSALHAVLNGVAWLQSGMTDKFLVGGSEASLTGFTIAQMKALKVYASNQDDYPCKALDLQKKQNTMVLGEGASVACLEKGIQKNALALIEGIGYATEILDHNVSISTSATCLQKSMKMATQYINLNEVDVVITHTAGTLKGDQAEINAIETIFGENLPAITSNKWKLGHTFATSGMLSMELAILMLQKQQFIGVPYVKAQKKTQQINKILVNAVGFGGNAVSVLVCKV